MKCPKCGYNSFEYNDACTKCSNDLTGYKETFGLKAIVLPLHARQNMADALKTASETAAAEAAVPESSSDVFSFDLPDSKQDFSGLNNDPFDFNDDDFTTKPNPTPTDDFFGSIGSKPAEKEDLSSLLESTPNHQTSATTPAATETPKGEFDLSDFSWDEPPAATKSGEPAKPTDDFSSLFGDSKGSSK